MIPSNAMYKKDQKHPHTSKGVLLKAFTLSVGTFLTSACSSLPQAPDLQISTNKNDRTPITHMDFVKASCPQLVEGTLAIKTLDLRPDLLMDDVTPDLEIIGSVPAEEYQKATYESDETAKINEEANTAQYNEIMEAIDKLSLIHI